MIWGLLPPTQIAVVKRLYFMSFLALAYAVSKCLIKVSVNASDSKSCCISDPPTYYNKTYILQQNIYVTTKHIPYITTKHICYNKTYILQQNIYITARYTRASYCIAAMPSHPPLTFINLFNMSHPLCYFLNFIACHTLSLVHLYSLSNLLD